MPKWFAPERIGSALAPRKVLGRVDPLGLAEATQENRGRQHDHDQLESAGNPEGVTDPQL